jgi:hypothetical protein
MSFVNWKYPLAFNLNYYLISYSLVFEKIIDSRNISEILEKNHSSKVTEIYLNPMFTRQWTS